MAVLCNHIHMSSDNDLLHQPSKASKNKSLKRLPEIFTVIIYFVVYIFIYTFLRISISIAFISFPVVIYYFYNYYLDHKYLPFYHLLIYLLAISLIISLSLLMIRRHGTKYFWIYLIGNKYNVYYSGPFGKYFIKWFVRGLLYLLIFLMIMADLAIVLSLLFTK